MMKSTLTALALVAALAATASAQSAPDPLRVDGVAVEYVTGRAHVKPQDGALVLEDTALCFTNNWTRYVRHIKTIFSIPLVTIVSVVATTEQETRAGAFSWHTPHSQDYVTITTETDQDAEAIVFKVDTKQAAGIAAKIGFAVKHAKAVALNP